MSEELGGAALRPPFVCSINWRQCCSAPQPQPQATNERHAGNFLVKHQTGDAERLFQKKRILCLIAAQPVFAKPDAPKQRGSSSWLS